MSEQWNARADDTRRADTLTTFIIFCEDEVSEPIYFKYFETTRIKVNPVPKQKSKMANVVKAITHCISEDLMEHVEGQPRLKAEDTQVWCVFDLDANAEANAEKRLAAAIEFDAAVDVALQAGIKVAYSNDAFELWILLHFEEVDPEIVDFRNRNIYYQKLTEHFRNIATPNSDLVKALSHQSFGYKRDLKQANNFRNIVRGEIIGKTQLAIARSQALEHYHEAGSAKPNHQKAPCTLVHHLVLELLKYGGKEIA